MYREAAARPRIPVLVFRPKFKRWEAQEKAKYTQINAGELVVFGL